LVTQYAHFLFDVVINTSITPRCCQVSVQMWRSRANSTFRKDFQAWKSWGMDKWSSNWKFTSFQQSFEKGQWKSGCIVVSSTESWHRTQWKSSRCIPLLL